MTGIDDVNEGRDSGTTEWYKSTKLNYERLISHHLCLQFCLGNDQQGK